jgi:hypothetical protein
MEWYRQVQFVSAVAMPPETTSAFGTTVNGMWADPEGMTANDVVLAHQAGRRVLFSVPMIALIPRVYEADAWLLDEVCRDVTGEAAECDWYYWESRPVYAACIYSDAFRRYLFERCILGIERGMDVVNLDEIMTSVGLMNRNAAGSGFCPRCLQRFRSHLDERDDAALGSPDDGSLRHALMHDDELYRRYRGFHEREAFAVMTGFIGELRGYAAAHHPDFTISANVGYLGSAVSAYGTLWGCLWGPHLDFVLLENHYRAEPGGPHQLLPRGTFAPVYRLGSAFTGAPAWVCPSIVVPKELAGQQRHGYYLLMFLEAYANGGRWGYYWWPGVDSETRLLATAPEVLKHYIRFINEHRQLYEDAVPANDLAILYADGPILRRPGSHLKYLALAQALFERGYQFDVIYGADGAFNPDELDLARLAGYRAILLPEARDLGETLAATLRAFAAAGGEVVTFSPSPLDDGTARRVGGGVLEGFWRHYRDEDREQVLAHVPATPTARIEASAPGVGLTRYSLGDRQVVHLLSYRYGQANDTVGPISDLRLRIPWSRGDATCTVLTPGDSRRLECEATGSALDLIVPKLDPYAVLVIAPARPASLGSGGFAEPEGVRGDVDMKLDVRSRQLRRRGKRWLVITSL